MSKTNAFVAAMKPDQIAAFWSHVSPEGGCWIWHGTVTAKGYGQCKFNRVVQRAHRVSFVLTFGAIADECIICHTCDNPLCVRPDHLFVGTYVDNIADKMSKGRQARGEALGRAQRENRAPDCVSWNARLSLDQADTVRAMWRSGQWTYESLGREYGIRGWVVADIIKGKTYNHPLRRWRGRLPGDDAE